MSVAFAGVCEALAAQSHQDAVTRPVAEKIMELAESGVHSRTAPHLMTPNAFKRPDSVQ
jgi:hypothetical protein